jgi:hypothetical protein
MLAFHLACMVLIALALLAEALSPKGVLIVPRWAWYLAQGTLGAWLLVLRGDLSGRRAP